MSRLIIQIDTTDLSLETGKQIARYLEGLATSIRNGSIRMGEEEKTYTPKSGSVDSIRVTWSK